jgi:integrase
MPSVFSLRTELRALGLAPSSVEDYYGVAMRADKWLTARGSSLATAPVDLLARYVETTEASWSTRKALHYGCRYYWEIVHRRNPPLAVLRIPSQPEGVCRAHTDDEAYRLVTTARDLGDRRGFAVFLGIYEAERRAEMMRSRWSDFAPGGDRPRVTIFGKGTKTRTVDLVHEVIEHPYFTAPRTSDYVFPGQSGGHVGPTTIYSWILFVADKAGVADCTPHRLRHTSLATAHDLTEDIRATSLFAGHSKIQTTERYTRSTADAMYAVANAQDFLHERPQAAVGERCAGCHAPPPARPIGWVFYPNATWCPACRPRRSPRPPAQATLFDGFEVDERDGWDEA